MSSSVFTAPCCSSCDSCDSLTACSQPLVVVEELGGAGQAPNLLPDVWLHLRHRDGRLLLEDGAAERGGEGEDQADQEHLEGGVGLGILFKQTLGVKFVHNQGDQHHP